MKSSIYALRTLMLASAPLTALVGQRIYFMQAQQEQPLPDVIMREISAQPEPALIGVGPPWRRRVQVTCRSTDYTVAEDVGEKILAVLGNFRGVVGDQVIHSCMVVLDAPVLDDTTNVVARVLDFRVHHS